ncbi:hypothetical protein PR202_ga30136 [Eleusine coracana subsp. coracana]|uniref:TF-B3 domain-containing protein n=1 Tax=Eleusine coracana subsp. coracana TaxID=191504 RepID=A0AAV5DNZ9_ELECO|nr:hypothetical protein PR202_ga30136 [Eleusine coracana subsp. coracana]
MASSGEHGAAKIKDRRLLLPFSFEQLVRTTPLLALHRSGNGGISDDRLVQRVPDELVQEKGSSNVRVFGLGPPAGIWPVEVEKDGDGAFLGRGWPEVAAASGAGEGWFLVLRHHGQGLLTIKGFDRSCCFRVLGTPSAEVESTTTTIIGPLKPKFISGLTQDFMEKLLIPAEFVEQYIPKEHLKHNMAILTGPVGEVCQVELEANQSSVVFTGGWSDFLSLHGITKVLSKVFCQKIGILEACRITLKTSIDSSTSWQVLVSPYKNSCHHITGLGWRRFYQENQIKVGDICTFNIVETTLWLAVITPSKI